MYDNTIAKRPPKGTRRFNTRTARIVSEMMPGDAAFAPTEFIHDSMSIGSHGVTISNITAKEIHSNGSNIELLLESAATERLFTPLTDSNFRDGAITADKISDVFPVYLGGTGLSLDTSYGNGILIGKDSDALDVADGFSWDGNNLSVPGDLVIDGEYYFTVSNGSLYLKDTSDTVEVNLMDPVLGRAPTVNLVDAAPAFSDSNVAVSWASTDPDGDQRTLYLSWYNFPDEQRTAKEVIFGTEAIGTYSTSDALNGQYTIRGLDPTTWYVVRGVVLDDRGNTSLVSTAETVTTEFLAPVAFLHEYVTSPAEVGFSSSNEADASDMTVISGLLTSRYPALDTADVLDYVQQFSNVVIPANTSSNVPFVFDVAYNPSDLGIPGSIVAEAQAYWPFSLYVDAESNMTLLYGTVPILNPDVTAPTFISSAEVIGFTETTYDLAVDMFDAAGIAAARVFVTELDADLNPVTVPDVFTIIQQGDHIEFDGITTLSNSHSNGSVAPLVHTNKYRAFIAAIDAGIYGAVNYSAVSNVDFVTLDLTPPTVDAFDMVTDGTSNAVVSWQASDAGPHGSVTQVHIVSTSNALTPEEAKAHPDTWTFYGDAGSETFSNIPAYEPTNIYVYAEDNASEFGGSSNITGNVSSNVFNVPEYVTDVEFSRRGTSYVVDSPSFIVEADCGEIQSYLVIYKLGEVPADGAAISNSVFRADNAEVAQSMGEKDDEYSAFIINYSNIHHQPTFESIRTTDPTQVTYYSGIVNSLVPKLDPYDVVVNGHMFSSGVIPAGRSSNLVHEIDLVHTPCNLAIPAASFSNVDDPMYPFVVYQDALSNASIVYGAPFARF